MHVAITGASSGIGAALARAWSVEPGTRLTLLARRTDRLEALGAELACPTLARHCDLADLDSVCSWIPAAEAAHGPVDVLINNAGIQYVEPAIGVSAARSEAMTAVNLTAPLRLIGALAPAMIARGSGAIVNNASLVATVPVPGMAHYNATKAAMARYSEDLCHELRGSGVSVLTLYLGPVSSDMEAAARGKFSPSLIVDALPAGSPDRLARKVVRAVRRGRRRLVYPWFCVPSRWFPRTATWLTRVFTPPLAAP